MNLNVDELQSQLQPALQAIGIDLWGLEVIPGHFPLLCIYVDLAQGSITTGEVGRASSQVIDTLRLNGVNTEQVRLEVSSPGFNRRLFTLAQCALFIGKEVAVKLRLSLSGRQRYKGILVAIEEEKLVIQPNDSEAVQCSWSSIAKVNAVADLREYLTAEKKVKRQ